jgi:hypothetical protein
VGSIGSGDVTQILDGPPPRAQPGESHWGCRHCTINLRTTNENAKEIGRNELCRALIERLELAEREASELADTISLAQKT